MNSKTLFLFFVLIFFNCPIAKSSTQKYFVINGDNNHLYQVVEQVYCWDDAKNYCHQLGGYLATITSQSENDFLFTNFSGSNGYWLGATNKIENGNWSWVTGEFFNYSNWNNDSLVKNENNNYLYFKTGEKWLNANINAQLPFICEFNSFQNSHLLNPSLNSKMIEAYSDTGSITIFWYEVGDFFFGFHSVYPFFSYKRPPLDSSEYTQNQLIKDVIGCEIEEWYIAKVSCNFTIGYDNDSEQWEPTYNYSGHPRDRSIILGCKRKNTDNSIDEKQLLSNINSIINNLHTEINNFQQFSQTLQEKNNEQANIINEKQEQLKFYKDEVESLTTEKEYCDISITALASNNLKYINEIEELNILLGQKENQNSILENKITLLNKQLYEKDTIISEYVKNINTSKNEINDLNNLLTSSTRYTLFLKPGWHLVSSIDEPATPKTEPVDCIEIIYSFDSGTYVPVTSLTPGRGYWVKILKQCKFVLEP